MSDRAPFAPVIPSEGWGVLHLAFSFTGPRAEPVDVSAAEALVDAFEAEPDQKCFAYAVLGQRADLGLMLMGPDVARLHRLHADLLATPLGARLEEQRELGYVSLTEASEYLIDDGSGTHAEMRDRRLHPRGLPRRRVICFYPMSKRRLGEDNWFSLPFDERRRLMGGHGRTGARFRERIIQLVTGSTGLHDWEWGVTLLSDDIKAIKDVVYEMRFDEASARFGEFGPFTIGLVSRRLRDAVDEAGLRPA